MNKNNKLSKEKTSRNSTKKPSAGRSEFIRSKLDSEYVPKLRVFKQQFIETDDDIKQRENRKQLEAEQKTVVMKAIQCFKNGDLINIDWKTKTNFRKSNLSVKLPRLSTEPINSQLSKDGRYSHKSRKGSKVWNESSFENTSQMSRKQKSLTGKVNKLNFLLESKDSRKKRNSSSFFQPKNNNPSDSLSKDRNKLSNSKIQVNKSTDSNQVNTIQSVLQTSRSNSHGNIQTIRISRVNSKQYMQQSDSIANSSAENENNSHNFGYSKNPELFRSLRRSQNTDSNKKFRKCSENIRTQFCERNVAKNEADDKGQSLKNTQTLRDGNGIIMTEPNSISSTERKGKDYDVLKDPKIYKLISKSRNLIIDFKEKIKFDSMTKIEKFKYTDKKRRNKIITEEKSQEFGLSPIIQKAKANQKKGRKIKTLSVQTHSKHFDSNDVSRLLTQSPKDKSAKNQKTRKISFADSSIVDELAERKWEQDQSAIKKNKRKSLAEIQDKIIKRAKLVFLKEDLISKFEEIRNSQSGVKVCTK